MMRKHWIDNLRWVTVLLVLLYHVIYFYNNKGVFGGVGGFGDGPQYQDVLMYVLYPWFMPLLFLLAGISSRYSLERRSAKEWFKSRTLKLLVPSTIGLFVFQWMTGYFNTLVARQTVLASMKQPALYFLWVISGTGPLWFIQDLWLFSLLLLLIRKITNSAKHCTPAQIHNQMGICTTGINRIAQQATKQMSPTLSNKAPVLLSACSLRARYPSSISLMPHNP